METLRARAEGFYVATMPVPEEAARLMADYLRDEMVHAQRQCARPYLAPLPPHAQ